MAEVNDPKAATGYEPTLATTLENFATKLTVKNELIKKSIGF